MIFHHCWLVLFAKSQLEAAILMNTIINTLIFCDYNLYDLDTGGRYFLS